MSRWRGAESVHEPLRVAQRMRVLRLGRGKKLLEILKRLDTPRAAPAQSVDDLVPRDRVDPGRKLLPGVPGVALEVDRQQGLLHCILDIRVARLSRARKPRAPLPAPNDRSPPAVAGRPPHRPRSRPSSFGTTDRPEDPRSTGAFIRASFRLVCRYRSGEIFRRGNANDAARRCNTPPRASEDGTAEPLSREPGRAAQ